MVVGLSWSLAAAAAAAVTLYVAPDGNDAWSGKLPGRNAAGNDGPLASLAGARDALRRLRAQGPLQGSVSVSVAAGMYQLQDTLVFEPQDSGTAASPVVYQAAPGARPVFTGGRKVQGFTPVGGGRWQAHLPEVQAGRWYFEDLYVNGRRATAPARQTTPITTFAKMRDRSPIRLRARGSCCPGRHSWPTPRTSPRWRSQQGTVERRDHHRLLCLGELGSRESPRSIRPAARWCSPAAPTGC